MNYLLIALAVLFGIVPALIGTAVLWYTLVLPMKPPADDSNRIAHLRLVWFALRTPEKFVSAFPWLRLDEGDLIERGRQ